MSALDNLLNKQTYSDKIVERLIHASGKERITSDSQFWIHRYVKEMNLRFCPWNCVIRGKDDMKIYQKDSLSFVQNCEIKETFEQLNLDEEALILLSKSSTEGQKMNYVLIYLPPEEKEG